MANPIERSHDFYCPDPSRQCTHSMASPSPVPSRALLNALRGVVFTTSCSVVLLAEERRRRIKLARTAIDNARKLHVVSRRGYTTAVASWETRFPELNDDIETLPPVPRTTGVRRRRRDSPLYIGQLVLEDGVDDLADTSTAPPLSERTDTSNRQPTTTRRPPPRTDAISRVSQRSNRIPISFSHHHGSIMKPASATSADIMHHRTTSGSDILSSEHIQSATSTNNTSTVTEALSAPAVVADGEESSAVQTARQCLDTPIRYDANGRPDYTDSLAAIEALLGELESMSSNLVEASKRLDIAMVVIGRLGPVGLPSAGSSKSLTMKGIRLLKAVVITKPASLTAFLDSLLLLCPDIPRLLIPFIRWLQRRFDLDTIRRMFQHLSHNEAPFWNRGRLLYLILWRYGQTQKRFEETKELYGTFQDAGLFQTMFLSPGLEYNVRRTIAVLALEADDLALAESEMKALYELHPKRVESDVQLQGALILKDGRSNMWNSVHCDIRSLRDTASTTSKQFEDADTTSKDFQNALTKITDAFGEMQPRAQLEPFVRDLVGEHGMVLEERWMFRVLAVHGNRQDLQSTLSWLEFCKNNGLDLSEVSFGRLWTTCLQYWGYSSVVVNWLQRVLQTGSVSRRAPYVPESEREVKTQDDVLASMIRLTREGRWSRVCDVYDTASTKLRFSKQCFLLFIKAHVKQGKEMRDKAVQLVQDAHREGHDVSSAVTVLLLAQIEDGIAPFEVVRYGLRQGIRLHGSVYNKAAQKLMANYDMRGAVAMCELAAQEDGGGELAYNEYNFSNLVFTYVGTNQHKALASLLSRFMSKEWAFWHGSSVCRESIKLAIKETARRGEGALSEGAPHRRSNKLLKDALEYVKSRPSTPHRHTVLTKVLRLAGVPEVELRSSKHESRPGSDGYSESLSEMV